MLSQPSKWNCEKQARERVHEYLERLHSANQPVTALTYEDAVKRADMAGSFVIHPYWELVSRMLAGTIKSETEQLLNGDEHSSVNRASVAICRKVLQMPFFDIEQGRMAEGYYQKAISRSAARRSTQSGRVPTEV